MSKPRIITPNTTYLVTRRCFERRYFLRPDRYVTHVFQYCLGYAAMVHDVRLHAFLAMSNHEHNLPTDQNRRLPNFFELFHGMLARAVNAYRGRWESFFAPGSYSAQPLRSTEDIIDKIAYILTNPVAAGIVAHARAWEGATSAKWRFGQTDIIPRPVGAFFDPGGRLPESVPLTLSAPAGLSNREADRLVRDAVEAREKELHRQLQAEGTGFSGMAAARQVDFNDRPATVERRRNLDPHVAGKDVELRVAEIEALREFRASYRAAWLVWRDGDRESAVFPYGTWLMDVRHKARCHPPPPS